MSAQLFGEVAHVVRKLRYFMVETVNLRRIADNRTERVQVIVELPLQVRRTFHFFFCPHMPCGLHQHDLLLVFQFLLGLVGINQNHSRKGRIVLRLYLRDTGTQQQNPYRDYPLHRSSFFIVLFSTGGGCRPAPAGHGQTGHFAVAAVYHTRRYVVPHVV